MPLSPLSVTRMSYRSGWRFISKQREEGEGEEEGILKEMEEILERGTPMKP